MTPTSYPLINADNPAAILEALVNLKVCDSDESITDVTIAGEGNMNLVLRVKTNQRSVIVKQARPWVEKYQEIAAPEERILSEISFYKCISAADDEVKNAMPTVVASNPEHRLMVLEDLGAASDYAMLYSAKFKTSEVDSVFEQAIGWVARLHACDVSDTHGIGCDPLLSLNHEHMFSIPLLDPPAIDLNGVCDGLTQASRALCADDSIRQAMEQLGKVYLAGGDSLLHGDYYPGSWLKTESGFRVIDPEFCFCGPREFDLGVVAAHWIFCGGEASAATIDRVCKLSSDGVSRKLIEGFAGSELIRRLTGVAQLPLEADLDQRTQWLECGAQFLRQIN